PLQPRFRPPVKRSSRGKPSLLTWITHPPSSVITPVAPDRRPPDIPPRPWPGCLAGRHECRAVGLIACVDIGVPNDASGPAAPRFPGTLVLQMSQVSCPPGLVGPGDLIGKGRPAGGSKGGGMGDGGMTREGTGKVEVAGSKSHPGRVWLLAAGLALGLAATLGVSNGRLRSVTGIPDVGNPFDVAEARRPIDLPDEENAYV